MTKIMKRLTVVLAMGAMMLSMAACGKEDPAEVYNSAAAKNAELTDMDMRMKMDMTMEMDGESMDMDLDMDMKMSGINTEDMLYAADMHLDMDLGGYDLGIDTSTYYMDGYCYTETMGQKMKYAMDLSSMMESIEQSSSMSYMTADAMKELSMEKDGDNRIITFVGDPAAMNDEVGSIMSMMQSQMGMLGSDVQMEIKEIKGTTVVDKAGYNSKTDMTMVIEMTVEGQTLSLSADTETELKNPGQPVNVEIPDVSDYIEIDMGY